jgi:hypothetical protein
MYKVTMASLTLALFSWMAFAAPPVRKYDDKGAPPFKVLKEGELPPLDAYDNFVIGPKYTPAPERKKVEGVPEEWNNLSLILRKRNFLIRVLLEKNLERSIRKILKR